MWTQSTKPLLTIPKISGAFYRSSSEIRFLKFSRLLGWSAKPLIKNSSKGEVKSQEPSIAPSLPIHHPGQYQFKKPGSVDRNGVDLNLLNGILVILSREIYEILMTYADIGSCWLVFFVNTSSLITYRKSKKVSEKVAII